MRKPKTLKEPLEVKHLGTSDVEQIQFPIREQQWEQHGYPFKCMSFPRKGGQGAENLRKKNRHVHEYEEDLRC
jgi:hypothetical protein